MVKKTKRITGLNVRHNINAFIKSTYSNQLCFSGFEMFYNFICLNISYYLVPDICNNFQTISILLFYSHAKYIEYTTPLALSLDAPSPFPYTHTHTHVVLGS